MFEGCSTVCPKCQHQFECPVTQQRRSLCGGGLVQVQSQGTATPESYPISPSQPIIFVLPPSSFHFIQHQQQQQQGTDSNNQAQPHHQQPPEHVVRSLRQCGWYYENITYQESQELLKDKETGTFLVRDSSDPRHLYSLSVRTERGPTSVRLHYANKRFTLEAETYLQHSMPSFASVVDLVEYYVQQSRTKCETSHVWVDSQGKRYSPITLVKPLIKDGQPPPLKHLARLAVHQAVRKDSGSAGITDRWLLSERLAMQLELPASVSQYLTDYPYSI